MFFTVIFLLVVSVPLQGQLVGVSECPEDNSSKSADSVCLQLSLATEKEASVLCTALPARASQPPLYPEEFWGAPLQGCIPNSTGYCLAQVRHLQPGARYAVFCADAATGSVLPECKRNGTRVTPCGAQATTIPASASVSDRFGVKMLIGAALLAIYMIWSFRFEHVHGVHETAVAVIAGLFFGFLSLHVGGETPTFDTDMFTYMLLPMIIFDAGFNLERQRFFWYSLNIVMYGLVGTVSIFLLIFYGSGLGSMSPGLFQTWGGEVVSLSIHERLIMASVLASTDTVAPIAFLPKESFPQLFAIVFGEGLLNDVVAILLSDSVSTSVQLPTIGSLAGRVAFYLVTSSAMGILFGLGVSYAYKRSEWLQEEITHPCALMLLLNYACYVLTDMLGFSSIFALFVCALICGHYAQFSLSEDAQLFADQISEFFSYCAESFVFGYFGFTAVGYLDDPDEFAPCLILFYSVCIIVARFFTVVVIRGSLVLLRIHNRSLHWGHAGVVAIAGCTRGAISYALILRAMPDPELQTSHQRVLVSTVLGIVLVNCLAFGSIFPIFMRAMHVERIPQGVLAGTPMEGTYRNTLFHKWRVFDSERLQPLLRRTRTGTSDDSFFA